MAEKKSSFWSQLGRRLQGQRSKADLARQLGVSVQTFASWEARGQFRRSLLPRLHEVLGWNVEPKQATRLGVILIDDSPPAIPAPSHPLETALRQADRTYRQAAQAFARYAQMTAPLIRAIGKNCFFAFSACTTSPYEFEKTDQGEILANEIAGAIQRGALCLYLRPTKVGIEYYERGWGYGRIVHHEDAVKEFADFRNSVREKLIKGLTGGEGVAPGKAGGQEISANDAEELVYTRLDQCYITRSPMWMPGVGIGMVGLADARDLTTRVTISLPGGKFGGVLVYPSYPALEYRFTQVLRSVVTHASAEVARLLKEATQGQRQHVQLDEESLKRLPKIATFYAALDRLLRPVSSVGPSPNALDSIATLDNAPAFRSEASDFEEP